jgi:hypothetical protein
MKSYERCFACDNFAPLKDQPHNTIKRIACKKRSMKATEFAFNGRITTYTPIPIPKKCDDFKPYKSLELF